MGILTRHFSTSVSDRSFWQCGLWLFLHFKTFKITRTLIKHWRKESLEELAQLPVNYCCLSLLHSIRFATNKPGDGPSSCEKCPGLAPTNTAGKFPVLLKNIQWSHAYRCRNADSFFSDAMPESDANESCGKWARTVKKKIEATSWNELRRPVEIKWHESCVALYTHATHHSDCVIRCTFSAGYCARYFQLVS